MTDRTEPDEGRSEGRAPGDIAAKRACMRCATIFHSEGFGQRICPRCKGSQAWRSSGAEGGGNSGRRTAARSS
ncbi:MAG: hypothetical protein ACK4GT_10610 [Pararhodobacter sp.]